MDEIQRSEYRGLVDQGLDRILTETDGVPLSIIALSCTGLSSVAISMAAIKVRNERVLC